MGIEERIKLDANSNLVKCKGFLLGTVNDAGELDYVYFDDKLNMAEKLGLLVSMKMYAQKELNGFGTHDNKNYHDGEEDEEGNG